MRGKKHARARAARQLGRACPGERESVKGAGAAPDFIHQHQTVFGGVSQNVRHLGHLHHKSGTPAGEIVGGADAREDAVNGTYRRRLGRHITAGVGEECNHRDLAHVGALAAHVGAGDELHAGGFVQAQRIWNETAAVAKRAFHHGMPAALNGERHARAQRRANQPQSLRALGEIGEDIQPRQRLGAILQGGDMRGKFLQEFAVELLFARQRAAARAEDFFLKGF